MHMFGAFLRVFWQRGRGVRHELGADECRIYGRNAGSLYFFDRKDQKFYQKIINVYKALLHNSSGEVLQVLCELGMTFVLTTSTEIESLTAS